MRQTPKDSLQESKDFLVEKLLGEKKEEKRKSSVKKAKVKPVEYKVNENRLETTNLDKPSEISSQVEDQWFN